MRIGIQDLNISFKFSKFKYKFNKCLFICWNNMQNRGNKNVHNLTLNNQISKHSNIFILSFKWREKKRWYFVNRNCLNWYSKKILKSLTQDYEESDGRVCVDNLICDIWPSLKSPCNISWKRKLQDTSTMDRTIPLII